MPATVGPANGTTAVIRAARMIVCRSVFATRGIDFTGRGQENHTRYVTAKTAMRMTPIVREAGPLPGEVSTS